MDLIKEINTFGIEYLAIMGFDERLRDYFLSGRNLAVLLKNISNIELKFLAFESIKSTPLLISDIVIKTNQLYISSCCETIYNIFEVIDKKTLTHLSIEHFNESIIYKIKEFLSHSHDVKLEYINIRDLKLDNLMIFFRDNTMTCRKIELTECMINSEIIEYLTEIINFNRSFQKLIINFCYFEGNNFQKLMDMITICGIPDIKIRIEYTQPVIDCLINFMSNNKLTKKIYIDTDIDKLSFSPQKNINFTQLFKQLEINDVIIKFKISIYNISHYIDNLTHIVEFNNSLQILKFYIESGQVKYIKKIESYSKLLNALRNNYNINFSLCCDETVKELSSELTMINLTKYFIKQESRFKKTKAVLCID